MSVTTEANIIAAVAPTQERNLPVLALLFAGSGCSALIYEIVWLQSLQLVIGSSAISLGILLGPLTQALVGHWITPQITFAIGCALSVGITLLVLIVLKDPQSEKSR